MRITLPSDGTVRKIFKGNKKCPKTVLISYSGAIINNADIYISSSLEELQTANSFSNNTGGNTTLDGGVGLFNQGLGATATDQPIVIPGVTEDIYARYDQQNGRQTIDIEITYL